MSSGGDVSAEELLQAGIPQNVVSAVEVLTKSGDDYDAYLAAVKGDYAEATRLMNEYTESTPFTESRAYWLIVLHETGNREKSRELTEKLDELPLGFRNLSGWLRTFGNLRLFDPADAPNLAAKLQQAGVDLDSYKELPRLSMMAQTSQ